MNVICTKGTTRLIKGNRYEVIGLYNDGTNGRYNEGSIYIKNFGKFTVKNFTDINGEPVPRLNIPLQRTNIVYLKYEDLNVNDILVCKSDNYKTIAKDCKYKIESLSKTTNSRKYVKFEGISRQIIFDNFKFRKLTIDEAREHSLNLVLSNESDVITKSDIRKIDILVNKDVELIKMLCRSAVDTNRHELGVRDWSIHQVARKIDLVQSDFEHLMDLPLRDILKILE